MDVAPFRAAAVDTLAKNMVLTSLSQDKLDCWVLQTPGWRHMSSMETCHVVVLTTPEPLCGSENGWSFYFGWTIPFWDGNSSVNISWHMNTRSLKTSYSTMHNKIPSNAVKASKTNANPAKCHRRHSLVSSLFHSSITVNLDDITEWSFWASSICCCDFLEFDIYISPAFRYKYHNIYSGS